MQDTGYKIQDFFDFGLNEVAFLNAEINLNAAKQRFRSACPDGNRSAIFNINKEVDGSQNCEAIAAPLKIIRSITRDKTIT